MDGRYIRRDGRYLKSYTELSSDGVSNVDIHNVSFRSGFASSMFYTGAAIWRMSWYLILLMTVMCISLI